MLRHVDYIKEYAANLTPVIPYNAKLVANSTIPLKDLGKVPGVRGADGLWRGIHWRELGEVTLKQALRWDTMLAGVGVRCGPGGVFGIDADITVKADADAILALTEDTLGKVAVRRVDHPDHHKFLICARMFGEMPRSFDVVLRQSDGSEAKIQFLGAGRYFNIQGVHPGRLKPYYWDNDPAHVALRLVSRAAFDQFWTALRKGFDTVRSIHVHSRNESDHKPEQCTPEELDFLLAFIPNDETFAAYDVFIAMGAAIYGASNGQPWGRVRWLNWCAQVDQGDPEKPEQFWDTMVKPRIGAEMLYRWASSRQPIEMAKRAFADPPIELEAQEEADADAETGERFLNQYALVGGAEFYRLPPFQPLTANAFNLINARDEKRLRRRFGLKRASLALIFAKLSPNVADGVTHHPGKPRFVELAGQRLLNLWSAPARPGQGAPVDMSVIDAYRELVVFVLGSLEEARLWFLWHAYLLQHPDWAPGWGWIVQTDQGMGKDLILRPIGMAHGADFVSVSPSVLTSRYNSYAERHLIGVSEMRETGRDAYTLLKAIASGNPEVQIHRKYREPYLAPNVAGFIIYSNELHPIRIAHDDRRFHVVSNFGVTPHDARYYADTVALFDRRWPMIGEYLRSIEIDAANLSLLRGNAPASRAKMMMAERAWERAYLDIVGEIESDRPPPGYLPIATTTDIIKWLKADEIPLSELPNRLDFPSELHRLGARPINPARDNPIRANPIMGARLWRIARAWRDQKGVNWDIESTGAARLAQLYFDRAMPSGGRAMPPMTRDDLTVIDGGLEDEDDGDDPV